MLALSAAAALSCARDVRPTPAAAHAADTVPVRPAAARPARTRPRRAAGEPTYFEILSGDRQTGLALAPLAESLRVRISDRHDRPVPGVRVSWSTGESDGRVTARSPATDTAGVAAAHWTLGATADTQTVRVEAAGFPPVELHATVPVATVAAEPRRTLWTGDVVHLDAAPRDAAGHALGGRVLAWSSENAAVASVAWNGALTGVRPGTTTVTARAGPLMARVDVTVLPAVAGDVVAADGRLGVPLRLMVRSGAQADTGRSMTGGRFTIRLAASLADSAELRVEPVDDSLLRPALVRLGPTEAIRASTTVLVPARWTIAGGSHAGVTVPISAAAALRRGADGRAFCRVAHVEAGAGSRIVGWDQKAYPIPVAFRRRRSGTITADDSAAFWHIVDELERDVGVDLFRPAEMRDPDDWRDGVAVSVETSIGGSVGANGRTFITYGNDATIYDASVQMRAPNVLHDSFIVTHEMLHALGFGHTSAWPSVLASGGPGVPRATAGDVAYVRALMLVRRAQSEREAAFGIVEAAAAELAPTRPAVERATKVRSVEIP